MPSPLPSAIAIAPTAGVEAGEIFPARDVLRRLALSETGFVFDPVTGQSFSASPTGIAVIQAAAEEARLPFLIARLCAEFDASEAEIERDLQDFGSRLRELLK